MKLIIGGSSGFVGTELVRQALSNPTITSIIGVSRRETPLPPESTDASGKLKSVICEDFENYSASIKEDLEDADACIWTIAVTPSKSASVPYEEVCKISRDYAITAIHTVAGVPRKQDTPLRFIYMGGHVDPRKRPEDMKLLEERGMLAYGFMRIETEDRILDFAEHSSSKVQAQIVKPGLIAAPGRILPNVPGMPQIELSDLAAALLDQVLHGLGKQILLNDDLVEIGHSAVVE